MRRQKNWVGRKSRQIGEQKGAHGSTSDARGRTKIQINNVSDETGQHPR